MLDLTADTDLVGAMRDLIRDATLGLAAAERIIPTLDSIANKTGLSPSQIEACYPSLDAVAVELRKVAGDLYSERDEAMPVGTSLAAVLDGLVPLRACFYEAAADFKHLADAAERFLPSVATSNAICDARYRGRLVELIEPFCGGQSDSVVAKVELITSWQTWRHLRGVQRLTVDQAIELTQSLLTAVASEVHQRDLAE
jgi:hypothetical protein